MVQPTPHSTQVGFPPGTHKTVLKAPARDAMASATRDLDQNMPMSHVYAPTQHTYSHHYPPPTSRGHDSKQQLEYYRPPARQYSSGSSYNQPQSADFAHYNPANTPPINRPPTFDHATHPVNLSHPGPHWEQMHPSNQPDVNRVIQRSRLEHSHHSTPQLPVLHEASMPPRPTGMTTGQLPLQVIEEGAHEIGEIVVEEMVKMRVYFEGLLREMRNQLVREQEEKESLKKRVHELETELLHLRHPQKGQ